jgi:hypothetical protein
VGGYGSTGEERRPQAARGTNPSTTCALAPELAGASGASRSFRQCSTACDHYSWPSRHLCPVLWLCCRGCRLKHCLLFLNRFSLLLFWYPILEFRLISRQAACRPDLRIFHNMWLVRLLTLRSQNGVSTPSVFHLFHSLFLFCRLLAISSFSSLLACFVFSRCATRGCWRPGLGRDRSLPGGTYYLNAKRSSGQTPAVYAEKEGDGPNKRFFRRGYDKYIPGKNILVVEDVLTTAGPARQVIDLVCRHRGNIVGLSALCNRGNIQPQAVGNALYIHWLPFRLGPSQKQNALFLPSADTDQYRVGQGGPCETVSYQIITDGAVIFR